MEKKIIIENINNEVCLGEIMWGKCLKLLHKSSQNVADAFVCLWAKNWHQLQDSVCVCVCQLAEWHCGSQLSTSTCCSFPVLFPFHHSQVGSKSPPSSLPKVLAHLPNTHNPLPNLHNPTTILVYKWCQMILEESVNIAGMFSTQSQKIGVEKKIEQ